MLYIVTWIDPDGIKHSSRELNAWDAEELDADLQNTGNQVVAVEYVEPEPEPEPPPWEIL